MPQCLNCRSALQPGLPFCPHCGQKAGTQRLSLKDIGHDLWHALTHTDHSVLGLIKSLLVQPGRVARDYVEGRRKAWFNPFTFLIVVVGVATLAMAGSGFVQFSTRDPVSGFLQRHLNVLIFLQVPLLAGFARLLFRHSGLRFAEELVLVAYASGLRSVVFTVVVAPLWLLVQGLGLPLAYVTALGLYLLVWVLYFGWACAQFHDPNWRWPQWVRGMVVALLSQAATTSLIFLSIYLGHLTG